MENPSARKTMEYKFGYLTPQEVDLAVCGANKALQLRDIPRNPSRLILGEHLGTRAKIDRNAFSFE
jgi:hypothetical protein